jgi:ABC-2 type transport system permease protein
MSRAGVIGAIVAKDLKAFSRDRFLLVMTALGLVFYVAVFWVLPDTVDETITLGVAPAAAGALLEGIIDQGDGGVDLVVFGSAGELRTAVESGGAEVVAGMSFPPDFLEAVAAGRETMVTVFVRGDAPEVIQEAIGGMVRELAYLAAGSLPPVTFPESETVVLGPDRAGDQVSMQERMRPLFAFFVLLVETFALATLVASEIQSRTATAIVVSPARISDFLAAKGLFGTGLAFTEALLLMALLGALVSNVPTILVVLLLGSVLVTGFGLLAGSTGKDFVGILFWSMLFMVPLSIPAFGVLFPGSASGLVRILPSWGLVEGILLSTAYGVPLSGLGTEMAALTGWVIVVFAAGWWTLRRRVMSL